MPTTLTPPEIDKRRYEPHDGDNGGRRPPTDKRTGGNGDGDNWDDRPAGRRGPRERLQQVRISLFFGLAAIAMFFAVMVAVLFVMKSSGHVNHYGSYIHEWTRTAVPRILILNTIVLFLSSITAELARRGMFREVDAMDEWIGLGRPVSNRATVWLAATLLLGAAFLAGQTAAWLQLEHISIFLQASQSRHLFYIITIAHAAHLALGIIALTTALVVLRRSRSMSTRQVFVDATVWYWHAMGALWLVLFLLLEFGQ